MKICHMFNIKLVTSPPQKIQWVLSHSSQLGGKNIVVLEYDVIKRQLSILLWHKNVFLVAQDGGLEVGMMS